MTEPVSAAPSDTGDYTPSAAPGHRLPHLWLREGASSRSTVDCMTSAFTVFAGRRRSWKRAVAQVTSWRVPLRTQFLPAAGGDEWTSLFGITDSGCVLMRPDGHVAQRSHSGTANPVAELRSALATALADDGAPSAAQRNHEEYGAATLTPITFQNPHGRDCSTSTSRSAPLRRRGCAVGLDESEVAVRPPDPPLASGGGVPPVLAG